MVLFVPQSFSNPAASSHSEDLYREVLFIGYNQILGRIGIRTRKGVGKALPHVVGVTGACAGRRRQRGEDPMGSERQ
jgi:hypothetical protein